MKKWIQEQKQFKDERGLTLVELLAVIVILAIVATIAFVAIGNVMENSKKDALIGNAQQMIESTKLYESTVESLSSGESVKLSELQSADVIETIYDPWEKTQVEDNEANKVTKTDDSYTVFLKGDKYTINATEALVIKGDRKDTSLIKPN